MKKAPRAFTPDHTILDISTKFGSELVQQSQTSFRSVAGSYLPRSIESVWQFCVVSAIAGEMIRWRGGGVRNPKRS